MNRVLFFLYASVITLLPAVALLPVFGADTAFFFLTGDAYLYLGIAESSTDEFFSFDGVAPTNGFHPLWQGYVWVIAQLTSTPIVLMNIAAWSAIGLSLIGIWLLGVATARATGSWLLAGLMTPGVYFLVAGQGLRNLSVWDFYSGMEAGLALALTGLAALLIVHFKQNEMRLSLWLALGVVLGLLMLTRLDEVFVGPAIAICWLIWTPGMFWKRVPAVLVLGIPPAIFLGLYWYYNLTHVGVLMPVSGAAKGSGALLANAWVTSATFFAPLIDLRAAVSDYSAGHIPIAGAAFRVAEVVFPLICSVFFVFFIRRYFRDQAWAPFVAGMCCAVIIKATYNLTTVNFWHQSAWYFSFAFGTISFATALLIAPAVAQLRRVSFVATGFVTTLIILVSFMQASQAYLGAYTSSDAQNRMMFWNDRADVEAALLAARPDAKVLEFGDGMLNYALQLSVRHGFVFAGDPVSLDALKEGQLIRSAYDDGYTVLSSYEYMRWPEASLDTSSDDIRDFLSSRALDQASAAELDGYDFEMLYIYEPLSVPFIGLSRRASDS